MKPSQYFDSANRRGSKRTKMLLVPRHAVNARVALLDTDFINDTLPWGNARRRIFYGKRKGKQE